MTCFLMFECQHPHRNSLVHTKPRDRMLTRCIVSASDGRGRYADTGLVRAQCRYSQWSRNPSDLAVIRAISSNDIDSCETRITPIDIESLALSARPSRPRCRMSSKWGGALLEIESGTSRTRSENHTTRPQGRTRLYGIESVSMDSLSRVYPFRYNTSSGAIVHYGTSTADSGLTHCKDAAC